MTELNTIPGTKESDVVALNAGIIIILTFVLVAIAWVQLHALNETEKSDFLLRVVNLYVSTEMVKARTIIHEISCQVSSEKLPEKAHVEATSNAIKNMRNDKNRSKEFMCIRNYLDFIEAVSFFYNENKLSTTDVNMLSVRLIKYYYEVFKQLIYYYRNIYDDNNYYHQLEKLVNGVASH